MLHTGLHRPFSRAKRVGRAVLAEVSLRPRRSGVLVTSQAAAITVALGQPKRRGVIRTGLVRGVVAELSRLAPAAVPASERVDRVVLLVEPIVADALGHILGVLL